MSSNTKRIDAFERLVVVLVLGIGAALAAAAVALPLFR